MECHQDGDTSFGYLRMIFGLQIIIIINFFLKIIKLLFKITEVNKIVLL